MTAHAVRRLLESLARSRREGVRARRFPLLAGTLLLGLVLFLLRDAVFQGRVFYQRDIHFLWYGLMETFVRSVRAGSWPLWDPYTAFGQPLLALPEAELLYPPTWLNLVMHPWTYYTLFVVAHLTFSGIGVVWLARRLGVSRAGAVTSGALWMLSGPFLSLVDVYHHFAGAAWMPWVLVAADAAMDRPGWRGAAAWGAAIGTQMLAGSADMCALTGLLWGGLLACRLEWPSPVGRRNLALVGTGAAALVLGLALGGAQWLPTLELARHSERWSLPSQVRTYWSLHPVALLELFWPVRLDSLPLTAHLRQILFGGRESFLASFYLGLASLPLVIASFWGTRLRLRAGLWAAGLLAVLASLGSHLPVYTLLVEAVPPLRMLRFPQKAMVVTALAWALLAGAGLGAWSGRAERRRAGAASLLAGSLILMIATLTAARLCLEHPELLVGWLGLGAGLAPLVLAGPARALLLAAVLLGLVLLAGTLAWRSPGRRWPRLAIAGLAVLDLLHAHDGLNLTAPRALFTLRPPVLDYLKTADRRRVYIHEYRLNPNKAAVTLGHPDPFRAVRFLKGWPPGASATMATRLYLLPPIGAAWGVESSYDLDLRGLYPRYLTLLTQAARALEGTPAHLRLLQVGAVGEVVALHTRGLGDLQPLATLPGLTADPIRVYRVPDPLPRSYVVDGVRRADGVAAIETLIDPGFDPRREVVLPHVASTPPSAGFRGQSRITEIRPDRVRLDVRLSGEGFVVLVDGYDPGWRATVDGRPATLLRANLAFRAVRTGPGAHQIELVYRPPSVAVGLGVSALALVLVLAGIRLGARSRHPPRAPSQA